MVSVRTLRGGVPSGRLPCRGWARQNGCLVWLFERLAVDAAVGSV